MPPNHVRYGLETKKGQGPVYFDLDTVSLLSELIQTLGHDPNLISVSDLQAVANRLSTIEKHEPDWGWRYLRNVLNRKIEASRKLKDAMMRLGAMLDNTPVELATSERVSILAIGNVRPGALVLANSRPCANPGCRIEFVPPIPNQIYHSRACRIAHYKEKAKR